MREPLTSVQQTTYDWIADYIAKRRIAPTIRELIAAMALKSPAPIQQRLYRLKKKGWIDWQPGKSRSIVLMGDRITLILDEDELAALSNCLSWCLDVPALKRIYDRIDDCVNEQEGAV